MLSSKFIIGARPTPTTEAALLAAHANQHDEAYLCVFETVVDGKTRYCCWAGGKIVEDPDGDGPPAPLLTEIGKAAFEALARLPFLAPGCALIFHGLSLVNTPPALRPERLRAKVIRAFRQSCDMPSVICFVGDLAGELDGLMGPAFNVVGAVELADCAGMARAGA